MSTLRNFIDFINEEYELVTKIKKNGGNFKNIHIPHYLEDHSILALADDPNNSNIFVELIVKGDILCLEYGDLNGSHNISFYFHNYDNIKDMINAAYIVWKEKMHELSLSEDDVSIDEFAK